MASPYFIAAVNEPDPKDPSWPRTLVGPINNFMAAVRNSLLKSLTSTENLQAETFSFTFTYNGVAPTNYQFVWPYRTPPTGCVVVRVETLNTTAPTSACQVHWKLSDETFVVERLVGGGFTSGQRYRITLLAFV